MYGVKIRSIEAHCHSVYEHMYRRCY